MEVHRMKKKENNEKIVEQYSDYIYSIIHKDYSTFIHEIDELYQCGVSGLLSGYQKYDSDKGEVTTFCTPFIRHEMNNQVRFAMKESSGYYYSTHKKVEDAKRKFEELGQTATIEKIMNETDLSRKIVERELKIEIKMAAYDMLENTFSYDFLVSDEMTKDIYLSDLDEKIRKIIEMKVLDDMSFTQIAKKMNTTKYFVEKAYKDGINILRKKYTS